MRGPPRRAILLHVANSSICHLREALLASSALLTGTPPRGYHSPFQPDRDPLTGGDRNARPKFNLPHLFCFSPASDSVAATPFSLACRSAGATCSQHAAMWSAPTEMLGGALRLHTSNAYAQRR